MNNLTIKSISAKSMEPFSNDGYIENDLAMIDDFQQLPIPREPRRVNGIIMGLYLRGKLS